MERNIKVLEELQKYCSLRSIGLVMNIDDNDEWTKFVNAISDIIDSYRTLEKHIAFYEKHGSYKKRIIELKEENEELKRLSNNKQWISPCYVAENYVPKSKITELYKEYYEKAFAEPYDCTTADYKHSQAMGGWRALNKLLMEDK